MDSFPEIGRLAPGAATPDRSRPSFIGQLSRRLFALPSHLGAAIMVTFLFSAAVLAIAAAYDAPLTIPRERVSAALGLNAVLPVAFAMLLYVALRTFKVRTGGQTDDGPPLLQNIAVDLTLMGLFLVVTYFHFNLKIWVQVINTNLYDETYYAIDQRLQPVLDLFFWIRSTLFTLIPKTDAWYQGAFLLMFITGFCSLAISRNTYYPHFCLGVLLTLSIGGLSYLVAPAVGPFIYEEGLNEHAREAQHAMYWAHMQAVQHGMPWIAKVGPAYFTGGLAAMPSLHIAQAISMTYFIRRAGSPLTVFFLLICFWVMVESVASRWHYLIDLPAGLAISILVIWLTNRLCSRRPVPAAALAPAGC